MYPTSASDLQKRTPCGHSAWLHWSTKTTTSIWTWYVFCMLYIIGFWRVSLSVQKGSWVAHFIVGQNCGISTKLHFFHTIWSRTKNPLKSAILWKFHNFAHYFMKSDTQTFISNLSAFVVSFCFVWLQFVDGLLIFSYSHGIIKGHLGWVIGLLFEKIRNLHA